MNEWDLLGLYLNAGVIPGIMALPPGGEAILKCEICGKSRAFGNNVSHSKRHTKRVWKPNVHPARLVLGGSPVRLRVCTRCLRTLRKEAG